MLRQRRSPADSVSRADSPDHHHRNGLSWLVPLATSGGWLLHRDGPANSQGTRMTSVGAPFITSTACVTTDSAMPPRFRLPRGVNPRRGSRIAFCLAPPCSERRLACRGAVCLASLLAQQRIVGAAAAQRAQAAVRRAVHYQYRVGTVGCARARRGRRLRDRWRAKYALPPLSADHIRADMEIALTTFRLRGTAAFLPPISVAIH